MEQLRPRFWIGFFGNLEMYMDGKDIGTGFRRSKKLRGVLEYLLANRERAVPSTELYEIFWQGADNPQAALKVFIHRLRAALVDSGVPQDLPCIIRQGGGYRWNPELDTHTDVDHFENAYQFICHDALPKGQVTDTLRGAVGLYRGRFLGESALWMSGRAVRLHNEYREMVFRLCTALEGSNVEEALAVCKQALSFDQFDDELNQRLIRLYVQAGRPNDALDHYRQVIELYYNELGVQPTEQLRELYQQIVEKEKGDTDMDVDSIRQMLQESRAPDGAFVCEYAIFRDLYRIEARCLGRYGGRMFLGLLTIHDEQGMCPPSSVLNQSMPQLLEVIRTSLRHGDVVSRFNLNQYVLLLPSVTHETGSMVLERIKKQFDRVHTAAKISLQCQLRPLEAATHKNELNRHMAQK